MKMLKQPFKVNMFDLGIFKLAMVALGVALASSFPEIFAAYSTYAWIIALVGSLYILWTWYK